MVSEFISVILNPAVLSYTRDTPSNVLGCKCMVNFSLLTGLTSR